MSIRFLLCIIILCRKLYIKTFCNISSYKMYFRIIEMIFWIRCGAGAQGFECNATVVGSIPIRENELLFINILIFSLWHSGKSPQMSSPIKTQCLEKYGGKWEMECVNTRFPMPTMLCAGCSWFEIVFFRFIFIKRSQIWNRSWDAGFIRRYVVCEHEKV